MATTITFTVKEGADLVWISNMLQAQLGEWIVPVEGHPRAIDNGYDKGVE